MGAVVNWLLLYAGYESYTLEEGKQMLKFLNRTFSRRAAAKSLLSAGAAGLVGAALADAAPQPHMQAALKALQNAAGQLEAAEDDKAGHRAKAIQLVSQAINQVQQGIQSGNRR